MCHTCQSTLSLVPWGASVFQCLRRGVANVCVLSSGHQYYIAPWFPALIHFDSCHLPCVGSIRCWEVGGERLIYFPIVTLDWVAAQWDGYMLNGMCVFWGQIPVQPSRPHDSENSLLCFRCRRIAGDEEGEEDFHKCFCFVLFCFVFQTGSPSILESSSIFSWSSLESCMVKHLLTYESPCSPTSEKESEVISSGLVRCSSSRLKKKATFSKETFWIFSHWT